MDPLVSIIIPSWNSEDCVGESIESGLAQTYSNIEVIVIDDGSTDTSLSVIQSFRDRIRFESRQNLGACGARNRGIELARGELIQFLDSDDLLHPSKLEQMVPIAMQNARGHIVVCDWEWIAVGGSVPAPQTLSFSDKPKDEVVWCTHHSLQTASPLHWRSVLTKVGGFDETLPCSQERDLHLRLACHGLRFVHVPKVLLRARRRPDSISSDSFRVLRQHLYMVQKAHRLLDELDRQTDQRSAALAGLLARDARSLLRGGLVEEATEYFHVARTLHQSGGLDLAYRPLHKVAAGLIGPKLFERLVAFKRSLRSRLGRTEKFA